MLRLPTVAEKSFLITIGDRTVTGLVNRDQMVGPWQIPVADCAVTAATYDSYHGEAMSMGSAPRWRCSPHAASAWHGGGRGPDQPGPWPTSVPSSGSSSPPTGCLPPVTRVKMPGLYEAVKAVGEGSARPLASPSRWAKDSMSMKTRWQQDGKEHSVTSPLSLLISGRFARAEGTCAMPSRRKPDRSGETDLS